MTPTPEQRMFVARLMDVSTSLAAWAEEQFMRGRSIEHIKDTIRQAMKIVEEDR